MMEETSVLSVSDDTEPQPTKHYRGIVRERVASAAHEAGNKTICDRWCRCLDFNSMTPEQARQLAAEINRGSISAPGRFALGAIVDEEENMLVACIATKGDMVSQEAINDSWGRLKRIKSGTPAYVA